MRFFTPVFVLLLCPVLCWSSIIHVPGDQPTIQAGIDVAVNGDTVRVAPGVYVENINFNGKAIVVESSGSASVTVIDGNRNGSVVTFENGEGPDSVLDGFTLSNGENEFGGGISVIQLSCPTIMRNIITGNMAVNRAGLGAGGGICCIASAPEIVDNTIVDNRCGATGGGIYCIEGPAPRIDSNIISSNQAGLPGSSVAGMGGGISCTDVLADGTAPGIEITNNIIDSNVAYIAGGGIRLDDVDCPLIEGNEITNNEATSWSGLGGGGIYLYSCLSPLLSKNSISGNTTSGNNGASGGGVSIRSSDTVVLSNNKIFGCKAGKMGGGIYLGTCHSITLINNTIVGNTAFYHAGTWGGGLAIAGQIGMAEITNCIFCDNWAPTGREIALLNHVTLDISYSSIKGGLSTVYVDSEASLNWKEAIINVDPQLSTSPVDLSLTEGSPCINRGTNIGAPVDDIDGDPRPYMGTVDLGADEFTGLHRLEADTFYMATSGSTVDFQVDAGTENAGRGYLVAAGLAGSSPGTLLPGSLATLPVNLDLFSYDILLPNINTILFQDFMGTLDLSGTANPSLNSPPLPPDLVGVKVCLAYCLDWPWEFVSNPIEIEIVP